ncbi:MAG: hypothetical protein O6918_13195 [Deltaproteobacteria bacterium]|nr:hypothetical protein [Deltaproteobacteria bacterium]MCZ6620451.1 hypothetical protein [Deltaproteobacteria bacterium]
MQRFRIALWLAAGIAGVIVFWLFQVLTGSSTIPQFMGQQIVEQGGYSMALTIPIGWGVHLGVSLSYSLLFAIVMLIPFSRTEGVRVFVGLGFAAVLGWVAALLTVPAITATISVLSGKGFPAGLPGLNTTFGLPFWNHELFFGVAWFIYLFIPYLSRKS